MYIIDKFTIKTTFVNFCIFVNEVLYIAKEVVIHPDSGFTLKTCDKDLLLLQVYKLMHVHLGLEASKKEIKP
jgi:hypothetical protein